MSHEYTETVFSVKQHYTVMDIPFAEARAEYTAMEFCANMKRFRLAKALNQEDLAELLNVSQATIQRWENGKREPSHSDLEKLAIALGVPVSDLFREGEASPLPSERDLEQMIQLSMKELTVGVSYADFPQAVSSSLHGYLMLFVKHGGFQADLDEGPSPGTDAPPPLPTRQRGRAVKRSQ